MRIHYTLTGPFLGLLAGILVLIVPRILNYVVAIYLILHWADCDFWPMKRSLLGGNPVPRSLKENAVIRRSVGEPQHGGGS